MTLPVRYQGNRVGQMDLDEYGEAVEENEDSRYQDWLEDHDPFGAGLLDEIEDWVPTRWGLSSLGGMQDMLKLDDLVKIDLKTTSLVVGEDKQVYDRRFGLIECLAPAKVGKDSPKVYVDKIDWNSFPPMEELAWLYDNFFSKYDREVVMLVGFHRTSPTWLYYVPLQEGTAGQVTWKASDEEMGEFGDLARWIGTIHVHPSNSCSPSSTDVEDWAEPEKSGLHLIFGRDGSYTINGAIAGKTFQLEEGSLEEVDRTKVDFVTSGGRSLEDLLTIPKRIVVRKTRSVQVRADLHKRIEGFEELKKAKSVEGKEEGLDFVESTMGIIEAFKVNPQSLGDLRIVFYNDNWYIMTAVQYGQLSAWCDRVCSTPTGSRLRIRPRKGE
ncbi:hypothetical protein LCGC14_0329990 [marine sediment metagenome]|uniref:JAB domain-containing protein n=1 Tax=marine sediment metagenome TaxID=412755 RepID=A0A0F9W425_9ZZZZ